MKAAVIGFGRMGQFHARSLRMSPDVEDVIVVDTEPDRLKLAAKTFMTAPRSSDLTGFVEAAVIATPTHSHADIATPLLTTGVDCLVEKPLAATLADAVRMHRAAAQGGALLAVGHSERFNPSLAAMLRALRPDDCRVSVIRTSPGTQGVEAALDLMVHDLDWIQRLEGGIESVHGHVSTEWVCRTMERARCRITYRHRRYELTSAITTAPSARIVTLGSDIGSRRRFDLTYTGLTAQDDPVSRQIRAFLDLRQGLDSPICTGSQALSVLEVIESPILAATCEGA